MAKVYAFMASGLEEVECLSVVDVLRRADIDVTLVSVETELLVTGSHNISILADKLFGECEYDDGDLFFLPGGMPGTLNLGNHEKLKELIAKSYQKGKRIAAICAAPSILGDLGLLKGKQATCYPGYEERLTGCVLAGGGVITDGLITTGKGLGYGLLMGIELIRILVGEKEAAAIKASILHP